jgi:hypothetical protein
MQPATRRHFVEHGFQQRSARAELIVNGEARHAGFIGDGLQRKSADPLCGAENGRRRSGTAPR